MGRRGRKKKSKLKKFILVLILCVIAFGVGAFVYKYTTDKEYIEAMASVLSQKIPEYIPPIIEEKKVEIYQGTDRPIAVMLDNNKDAWPHSGINSAYIVYEIIVEGGETRLMALFKGESPDSVGPVRSARHYYLDYALENDAIYAHLGWSPQAQSDIRKYGVDNIQGQAYDTGKSRTATSLFWRSKSKYSPHNAYTSIAALQEIAADKKYELTSEATSILHYVVDEVELESDVVANEIVIPFSTGTKTKFVYDSETKRYTRYCKGIKQTDELTGEDVTTKNIIITFADNYTLKDAENKGRQGLKNTGTKDGYYITNGKAIKITCEKSARDEKTRYLKADGTEIDVNDGNTYINICPVSAKVTIN